MPEGMNASLLTVSFRDYAVKMSGFNNAMAYTLKNAVAGTYPAYTVDYSMALISRGDLPNAASPLASATGGGNVKFNWTNNSGVGKAMPTDKSVLVVYCPDKKQCIYTTTGADRSIGVSQLNVNPFTGLLVQTYIGFLSSDGRDISNSYFTGELTVTG